MDTPHLKINGIIENNRSSGNIRLPVNLHQQFGLNQNTGFRGGDEV